MRVLIANKLAWAAGGADRHALDLARGLRDRGHEVRLLSTADIRNEDGEGAFAPQGVSHDTRDSLGARAAGGAALRALWNRAAAAATERLVDDFRPDVLHAHKLYPQLSAAPVRVAARRGVAIVQTLHDYELLSASPLDDGAGRLDRHESRLRYRALNTVLHRLRAATHVPVVDEFIAVSGYVARAYRLHAQVNPLPAPALMPAPPPFEQRCGVAFAGRLAPEKGVGDVLDLAGRLDVTVAGAGPLEHLVRHGPVDYRGRLASAEVRAMFGAARVVVVPSRWAEPAGLVALEAMAAGTPVVAYRTGGLAEYVAAGGGVLTDPGGLATACRSLHDDHDEWERVSTAGRRAAATTFSEAGHLERTEAIYERVAG